jgi:hypothetical protein
MSNDNHIDRLQRLAKAQDSGPRSARDLAVLEAAKTQAALDRGGLRHGIGVRDRGFSSSRAAR